ncbi:MAG: 7 transmembrane receptor [archaeon]|nr:7 transmembrane receptor [archaeon]
MLAVSTPPSEATDYQNVENGVSVMTDVLMIMSIVSAGLTFLTFAVFGDLRTYPIRLIMYLCVCIVVGFTFFLVAFRDDVVRSDFCKGAAVLTHFFFIANFYWTFCIAFNFYQMIVRRNRESQRLEKWYHLLCWGLPSILVTIVGALGYYGPLSTETDAQTLCYITNDIARFITFFIPGLIAISANCILFFFIGREIHETLSGAPKSDQRNKRKEFQVYISIFISIGLSWIFGYLMFIIPDELASIIFLVLFSIFTPLQGVLLFLFYCLNKKVFAKWLGLIGFCIPVFRNWADQLSTDTTSASRTSNRGSSRSASHAQSGNSSSL